MKLLQASGGVGIALQGLAKQYGGREVLRALDLQITPGEFVAIVGRSGCGKSTLLRLLPGLEAPSAGTIGGPGASTDTRFMFQGARERAQQALAQVALAERGGEWPARLPGGQDPTPVAEPVAAGALR